MPNSATSSLSPVRQPVGTHSPMTGPSPAQSNSLSPPPLPQQQHDVAQADGDLGLRDLPPSALQDLELMHLYTRDTYLTMAFEPRVEPIWQVGLCQEAFRHAFLMHGILAVAALHMALTVPSAKRRSYFQRLGMQHHTLALQQYRPVLANVTDDNCDALFGFSVVAPAIQFAASQAAALDRPAGAGPERDLPRTMHGIFHVLKGIYHVVHLAMEAICRGPLAGFVQPQLTAEEIANLPALAPDLAAALDLLAHRVDAAEALDAAARTVYATAIELLRRYFRQPSPQSDADTPPAPDAPTRDWTKAILWPIEVPRAYMDALDRQRPAALAVLAFYGVLLDDLRDAWWAGDRGVRLIEAVADLLGGEWADVLAWPQQRVEAEAEARAPFTVKMELE